MPRPSRKQALLDAGIVAMLDQGAAQTTVDAVCAEVGVTKGAFFHHFADKDAFVLALLQHFGERGAARLGAVDLAQTPDAAAHLSAYLAVLARIYGRHPWFRRGCLFLIVAQEYEAGSPVRRQCEQGLDSWIDLSAAEFDRIAARTGRPPRVNTRGLAEMLLFTIEGALQVGRARRVGGSVRRALKEFEPYARMALQLDPAGPSLYP